MWLEFRLIEIFFLKSNMMFIETTFIYNTQLTNIGHVYIQSSHMITYIFSFYIK